MLADAGCNGDPIDTRSTCLQYLLLNVKNDLLVAVLIKLLKSCLEILVGLSLPLYNLSTQISMAWSRGVVVNKESTSRLAICKLGSSWQVSSVKWNEWMTVYSLNVEGVKKFNENFTNL